MNVLGIEVDDALVAQWGAWYAPEVQPFFVESTKGLPKSLGGTFTQELRDTFKKWSPENRGKKVVWYDAPTAERVGFVFHSPDDALAFVIDDGLPNQGRHELVGFAHGSGPNCFGAVMGAAGVHGAQNEWMQLKPFNEWLTTTCTKGGRDDEPDTVLVWRSTESGDPFHAALTVGDGFALEKPSQCWWSPRYVTTVAEIKRVTRMNGIRLERWRLRRR